MFSTSQQTNDRHQKKTILHKSKCIRSDFEALFNLCVCVYTLSLCTGSTLKFIPSILSLNRDVRWIFTIVSNWRTAEILLAALNVSLACSHASDVQYRASYTCVHTARAENERERERVRRTSVACHTVVWLKQNFTTWVRSFFEISYRWHM